MRFFSSTPLVLHSFESACKEIRASQASCSWELNQCRVLCVCVCVCVCDGVYFGHAWTPERFPLLCSVCDFSLLVIFSLACAGASSSDSQIFLSFCNSPPAFYSPKSFVLTPRGAGFPLSKRGKKINKYIFFLKKAQYRSQPEPRSFFRNQWLLFLFSHRHFHSNVYSPKSGSLPFTFYSLVPVLQSGVFVRSSVLIRGGRRRELVITRPCVWAPPGGQMELVLA